MTPRQYGEVVDGVRACIPGLRIYRSESHVLVIVLGPDKNASAQIDAYQWRNLVEDEAIALGLIKPAVGAAAEPAVLAEMVLDV